MSERSNASPGAGVSSNNRKIGIIVGVVLILLCGGGGIWWLLHASGHGADSRAQQDVVEGAGGEGGGNESPGRLTVRVDQPGAAISPTLYGIMIEEINHSLDGGLYAELLRNRDLSQRTMQMRILSSNPEGRTIVLPGIPDHWSISKGLTDEADLTLDTTQSAEGTHDRGSLRLNIRVLDSGRRVGVANAGYWGIPVKPDWEYRASFYARASEDFSGPLTLTIQSKDRGTPLAQAQVEKISNAWQRYEVKLKSQADAPLIADRFVISAAHTGTIWVCMPSLFPPTYNNRPNGNRIDIMEKLAALNPAFVQFPSGDFMIGYAVDGRFNWKDSIGPVDGRPTTLARWHRTSNGFGLLEFLQTCEDLKSEPVLGVYAGTSAGQRIAPGTELQPYVTEALEEIEYITGDKSTTWGARRAADGHPEPFKLRYVQIGNNEHLYNKATYDERFTQFYDAIKAKYPDLKIIGWTDLATTRRPDATHEQFYANANGLMAQSGHYDSVDHSGPMRFKAEYNAREGDPTKSLYASLADAAWLMGAERNSDAAIMVCPAPLFVNINGGAAQLPCNAIGFDALSSFGSPAYHMQRLFIQNRGDTILPVDLRAQDLATPEGRVQRGAVGVGTWGTDAEFKEIKVTAPDGKVLYESDFSKDTGADWQLGTGAWKVENGALHQTSNLLACRATVGDPNWTDYTLTLKARKNAGGEGFLIYVHAADVGNFVWWNIGGWGNSRTGLEQTLEGAKHQIADQKGMNPIETGRWYDVRVEVHGSDVVCFLDDAPLINGTERQPDPPSSPMFATASRDNRTGEIIIKVVNVMPMSELLEVNLSGVKEIEPDGVLEEMAGKAGDMNSIEKPDRVVPRRVAIHFPGTRFEHRFPPHSLSVIRVKVKK